MYDIALRGVVSLDVSLGKVLDALALIVSSVGFVFSRYGKQRRSTVSRVSPCGIFRGFKYTTTSGQLAS